MYGDSDNIGLYVLISGMYMFKLVRRLDPVTKGNQVTVSLKVVSRKRRRKCTLKSYDRFTNS
jgi:hypothetical protein